MFDEALTYRVDTIKMVSSFDTILKRVEIHIMMLLISFLRVRFESRVAVSKSVDLNALGGWVNS